LQFDNPIQLAPSIPEQVMPGIPGELVPPISEYLYLIAAREGRYRGFFSQNYSFC